jgi:hypothetical protein
MAEKYYRYKLLSDAPVKIVSETRNGFVIFEDGSRIEQNRLLDLFEEVSSVNVSGNNTFTSVTNTTDIDTMIKEQSKSKDIITPKQNIHNELIDVDVVNPDTFFDDTKIINNISTQAEKLAESLKNAPVDDVTGARVIEPPAVLPVEDNPGPVKQVIVNRDDYKPNEQQKEGFQPLYTKTGEPINPNAPQQYQAQSNNVLGNTLLSQMKRNKKIKLNLKVDETMPNPTFIKMMDENFNGGILDYLVTDMVSKLLNNPTILEKQIRESLEDIVYGKKRKTTRKTSTKRTVKKTPVKNVKSNVENKSDVEKSVKKTKTTKKENKEENSKDD